MPGREDSYSISIPISPPPPQNLSTYSRFIHDHTKRQMESFGAMSPSKSGHSHPSAAPMTNGTGVHA